MDDELDNSSTSSITSISSSDEKNKPKIKRYKQHLFFGYNPDNVSNSTRKRWEKLSECM